jgi:hypothetical protein
VSEVELHRAERHERKRQKLSAEQCLLCSATDVSTLQSVTLCTECRLAIMDKATSESHHLIGRLHSSFSIKIPANLHAIFSDMALDHPRACKSDRALKILYAIKDLLELLYEMTISEIETREGKHE